MLIFDGTSFTLERLTGYCMVKPTKTKISHIPTTMTDFPGKCIVIRLIITNDGQQYN